MLCFYLAAVDCAAAESPVEVTAALNGDATRPASALWLRTELYLAVGRADDPAGPRIDEATWRAFLDAEVTPRFPDGFSVLDAYGQWRGRESGRIGRLESKVIVILHPDAEEADERIEALRRAFKTRFGQYSVLRVTGPVEVSF
ncbi:MAG: DUF3574 domain-containing protein [Pseudomonadales bacterium]|jgi:hypothetical protein|nr:DUF3574 domain-containing protein [Pseudomonadales bacterium]